MRLTLVTALTVAAFCFVIGNLAGVPRAPIAISVLLLTLAQLIILFGPR